MSIILKYSNVWHSLARFAVVQHFRILQKFPTAWTDSEVKLAEHPKELFNDNVLFPEMNFLGRNVANGLSQIQTITDKLFVNFAVILTLLCCTASLRFRKFRTRAAVVRLHPPSPIDRCSAAGFFRLDQVGILVGTFTLSAYAKNMEPEKRVCKPFLRC